MALVVLAERRTNYFSRFFRACFLIKLEEVSEVETFPIVETVTCSVLSRKLEVVDLCELRAE